jgi:lipopolysaccharide/colanic/teichoic acid biosynthesis glycosyltransferase
VLFHHPDIESVHRQRDLHRRTEKPPTPGSHAAGAGEPVDRVAGAYERWVKPSLDRLVAAMLLVLVLPVLLLVGCAVLLSLGRPVVLSQERVGLHGSPFVIRKFRTMRHCRRQTGSLVLDGPPPGASDTGSAHRRRRTHKHPHDPRLVPVGRFLRTWSLDELPQLYNVLRGDMSLVGPRPEMPGIVECYEPWQHARHLVRPGITGLWQVGDRGRDGLLMHHCTDVDLRYVEGVSFWLDVKLLLLTVPAVLGLRKGI